MKTVQLTFRDAEDKVAGQIQGDISDDDIASLTQYLALVDRVRDSALLVRGMPGLSGLKFDSSGFHLTASSYSNAELHELLHVLRPLLLEEERCSYAKTAALLKRRFRDKNFTNHLKTFQRIYDHGEMSLYMQLTIGDAKLFDRSLLHTWLNGKQYHTDAEKAKAWEDLEKSLTEEGARALVISQLQGKVKAIFQVAYLVSLVTSKRDDA